ncbi:hypothetical protein TSMEX_006373, partial [Taenia solium]
ALVFSFMTMGSVNFGCNEIQSHRNRQSVNPLVHQKAHPPKLATCAERLWIYTIGQVDNSCNQRTVKITLVQNRAAYANPPPLQRACIPRRDYCGRAPPELPPRWPLRPQLSATQATDTPSHDDEQKNAAVLGSTNLLSIPRGHSFDEPASQTAFRGTRIQSQRLRSRPQQICPPRSPRWKALWLMIENIPETQQSLTREFKNGDIVRWLNYDPKYLELNPGPLPDNELLECETRSGECLIVPSENARLISSKHELAQLLQHRPRAEVVEAFVGTSTEELSVRAGEVIHLLFECGSADFMAVNKIFPRGRVPKRVLNVVVAPSCPTDRPTSITVPF